MITTPKLIESLLKQLDATTKQEREEALQILADIHEEQEDFSWRNLVELNIHPWHTQGIYTVRRMDHVLANESTERHYIEDKLYDLLKHSYREHGKCYKDYETRRECYQALVNAIKSLEGL